MNEKEELERQVFAEHRREIEHAMAADDRIEFIHAQDALPDILTRGFYRLLGKVRNWTVCLVIAPRTKGILTIAVVASVLIEALHCYYPHEEHLDQLRAETSSAAFGIELPSPAVNGLIVVRPLGQPNPHVPEEDFLAHPNWTYPVAALSGLSTQISGSYLG